MTHRNDFDQFFRTGWIVRVNLTNNRHQKRKPGRQPINSLRFSYDQSDYVARGSPIPFRPIETRCQLTDYQSQFHFESISNELDGPVQSVSATNSEFTSTRYEGKKKTVQFCPFEPIILDLKWPFYFSRIRHLRSIWIQYFHQWAVRIRFKKMIWINLGPIRAQDTPIRLRQVFRIVIIIFLWKLKIKVWILINSQSAVSLSQHHWASYSDDTYIMSHTYESWAMTHSYDSSKIQMCKHRVWCMMPLSLLSISPL